MGSKMFTFWSVGYGRRELTTLALRAARWMGLERSELPTRPLEKVPTGTELIWCCAARWRPKVPT
jgi:hypothetical protein